MTARRVRQSIDGSFRMPASAAMAVDDDPDFFGFQKPQMQYWFPHAMAIAKKVGTKLETDDLKWGPIINLPDIEATEDYLLTMHKCAARLDLSLKSSGDDAEVMHRLRNYRLHINKVEQWLSRLYIRKLGTMARATHEIAAVRKNLREDARVAVQMLYLGIVETVMFRFPGSLLPRMYGECGVSPGAHPDTYAAAIVDADMRFNKGTTRGPVVTLSLAHAAALRSTAVIFCTSMDPDIEPDEMAGWKNLYYVRLKPFSARLDEYESQCQAGSDE